MLAVEFTIDAVDLPFIATPEKAKEPSYPILELDAGLTDRPRLCSHTVARILVPVNSHQYSPRSSFVKVYLQSSAVKGLSALTFE